ncbi:MAG TPA: CPBP family glutamic-type intramembrane protease, partial [Capsulimonadaceae bacterium]|nr:CPBP family glutamic-type intramembrane protease [Capsulimonadaceae bacterium]
NLIDAGALLKHVTHAKSSTPAPASEDITNDLVQGIETVDLQAKFAYLAGGIQESLMKYGALPSSAPPPKRVSTPAKSAHPVSAAAAKGAPQFDQGYLLSQALDRATSLYRDHPSDVMLASRVILIRAESDVDPLAPMPATKKARAVPSPLTAFTPTPDLPAGARATLEGEAALWRTLFSSQALPASTDTAALARQIRAIPDLRWWGKLALHQLYLRANDKVRADKALAQARAEATSTLIPSGVIGLGTLAAEIIGFVLLIFFISRRASDASPPTTESSRSELSLFDTVPPRITNSERRLGAGDLLDVFVAYLFLLDGFALILQLAELHWKDQISRMPQLVQLDIDVAVNAVAYLGGSFAAFALLRKVAAARGASLGTELGLTVGSSLRRNILFGLAGWSMGLVLLIVVGLISQWIFRHAPAPSNPAIPMLITASDVFSRVTLLLLVSVAAPFFEETFFRGVLFNALRMRYGPWPAILLTGLMFGLAHPVGIAEEFTLASLGCVLAWMAEKRKSLAPTMTAHCMVNSVTFLQSFLIFMIVLPR